MSEFMDPKLTDCRRIFLKDLSIEASIGFHDFEKLAPQRVLIKIGRASCRERV